MRSVARVTGIIGRIALYLSGTGLVIMTAMIAAQVFWRYVLNDSIIWTEPGSVMVMGWFIFLGAAVGVREGYHLSFDVMLMVLPNRAKLWCYSVSDLVVVAFGFGMIWYGTQLALKTAGNKLPSLGISGAFDFIPLVGGGVLLVIFSLERLARRAAGMPTARFGETVDEDELNGLVPTNRIEENQ
ncbi:TRAP transporter small permease [Tropicimonas isoalkanivorans]|uniref:TRAP transporter small permease protein n=1 Tax=Tropicimonas isoalkanivorans TaxID=441112 RepID=A0A1I1FT32_9RHOB|nr:TRAP transporter small permease [Tropicimonas isoalkanivorans]SFC02166.1 TRAP-type C4-dicarboxylate transport system, small permease component [Tropicimonas isoalkanivorans]